ncbi:hypothetical protein AMS68_004277 [Peltaster fructicola]|uniref:Uncharacterized protein n=1 Tax=Peltaster fructicola TaxID=286661 RepID=A0A6H0XWD9_9PEZI|nr:hypothetical protein AMS68_004277 [Peltaster fructicola]
MALTGFHYSTCGAGGLGCGDAAHNITEECERLLCETLKAVFLVEKDTALENSLVMDVPKRNGRIGGHTRNTGYNSVGQTGLPTPSASPGTLESYTGSIGMVKTYLEMYDYTGGVTLRGLVAEKDGERALFAFFSKTVIGEDLKPGLTALLELASTASFDCSQLIVCVDRTADAQDSTDLVKDLGW